MKNELLSTVSAENATDTDLPSPKRGRYSLREYRTRNGMCWRILFQPFGVSISPSDITVMTMKPGEIWPTGKRAELARKLVECSLPWALEFADVRDATQAYLAINGVHDAAASIGLIATPTEDAAAS